MFNNLATGLGLGLKPRPFALRPRPRPPETGLDCSRDPRSSSRDHKTSIRCCFYVSLLAGLLKKLLMNLYEILERHGPWSTEQKFEV